MQAWVDMQYGLLKRAYPKSPDRLSEESYEGRSKLMLLGDDLTARLRGKTVIDFGCGRGDEAIEMAQRGAARVIGIDIREDLLAIGRQNANLAGGGDARSRPQLKSQHKSSHRLMHSNISLTLPPSSN